MIDSIAANSNGHIDVQTIKASLPALFQTPALIGEYGRLNLESGAMNDLSAMMEASPITKLASKLGEIVAKLSDADPQRLAKKPTWLEKLTGKSIEGRLKYFVARKHIDVLLDEAAGPAQGVREAVVSIERLLARHGEEVQTMQTYIQAGRDFLSENPDIGKPDASEMNFDNHRERFARKIANLATLLASHEMSSLQMRMTKSQAIDMLDRFEQTSNVLVPVWRQHTLALTTSQNMSPEMLAAATKAHDALMRSLAESMASAT